MVTRPRVLASLPPTDGSEFREPAGALIPVSGASLQLRALAALSGSLTDALDPGDAAAIVEKQALAALGATSALVMTFGTFPPTPGPKDGAPDAVLGILHAIGRPAEVMAETRDISLASGAPLAEVAHTGQPVFLPTRESLQPFAGWGAAMIEAEVQAAAIVPVWANGELRGVLGLTWPAPREFGEDERAFVLTLGIMCAQSIMRAHLRAAERAARLAAEAANASKTKFLATVSHELRTPMNAVIGYTELVAEEIVGPVSALQKEHLGRVRASGQHLLGLIEDLLAYARLETGGVEVRIEPVVLADVIAESLVLVGPAAARKGIVIHVERPPAPVSLLTDARKLRQILVNLLANAVKFSGAGDVRVRVPVEGDAPAATVRVQVADRGRGIAAADHERIFDPYWQEDPTLTRSANGTGLGLSVARELARLLGGDVVLLESHVDRGSTFEVVLPARYTGPLAAAA